MERLASEDFWPRFFFWEEDWDVDDDEDDEDFPTWEVRFELGAGYALVLQLDLELAIHTLLLEAPELAEPVVVGENNDAHPIPVTMTWDELDLVARAVAVVDPGVGHPGPAVALMSGFLVLDPTDDRDVFTPVLDAAFAQLRHEGGTGPRRETRYVFDAGYRDEPLAWGTTADGHRFLVSDEYTYRRPAEHGSDEPGFPFKAWQGLLDRARLVLTEAVRDGSAALVTAAASAVPVEAAWAQEELDGSERGSLIKERFGRSWLDGAETWFLRLVLDHPDGRSDWAHEVAAEADAALRAAGIGRAEADGATATEGPDGETSWTSTIVGVDVRDDLPAATTALRGILATRGRLECARLIGPSGPVPLGAAGA